VKLKTAASFGEKAGDTFVDAGAEQRVRGGLKLALDADFKLKRNLLDEGQFGSCADPVAIQLRKGLCLGGELSANYTHGPIDLWAKGRSQHELCAHRERPSQNHKPKVGHAGAKGG
jgi:hypothetical protein